MSQAARVTTVSSGAEQQLPAAGPAAMTGPVMNADGTAAGGFLSGNMPLVLGGGAALLGLVAVMAGHGGGAGSRRWS
jgi:hypothetical protein